MNKQNLAPRTKVNIYDSITAGKGKLVPFNGVILGTSATPEQMSCSGIADQHNGLPSFFLFFYLTIICLFFCFGCCSILFSWFCCCIEFLFVF